MDVYRLGSNSIPPSNMTHEEHHRFTNMALILTGIAIVIGFLYWWFAIQHEQPVTIVQDESKLRSEIASLLRSAPAAQVSPEEVTRIASQLRKTRDSVSATERENIANILRNSK